VIQRLPKPVLNCDLPLDIVQRYGETIGAFDAGLHLHRIRRRVERDPNPYTDRALAPVDNPAAPPLREKNALAGATAWVVSQFECNGP
jgi:hypothetical protein